jgi:hypothetical protein
MPRTAEPRTRATRAAAAAIGLTAALSLAACASGTPASDRAPTLHKSSATASPSPAPQGVVTLSEANKILDTDQDVNNRAKRDPRGQNSWPPWKQDSYTRAARPSLSSSRR